MSILIAPSVIAADFADLRSELLRVTSADLLHVDIMDGHFVPNITFGPFVVKRIKSLTALPLDVHLMIAEPRRYLKEFAQAGAANITFHLESNDDVNETIREIHALGLTAGISLKPGTPFDQVEAYLSQVQRFLVMTVEPGFGGQHFMPDMLPKVAAAKKLREQKGWKYDIEVDGGLAPDTIKSAVDAGAEVIVAGTAVFGRTDAAQAIAELRAAVN